MLRLLLLEVRMLNKIIWALFGNDEDGMYGLHSGVDSFDITMGGQATTIQAVHWWLRNPFHNLMFHVLNWEGGPFWAWKAFGWNGYIGFRPHPNGVFGIAFRKGNKKYGES